MHADNTSFGLRQKAGIEELYMSIGLLLVPSWLIFSAFVDVLRQEGVSSRVVCESTSTQIELPVTESTQQCPVLPYPTLLCPAISDGTSTATHSPPRTTLYGVS